jgi:transcriptional regulator with XRE-family HTH domain
MGAVTASHIDGEEDELVGEMPAMKRLANVVRRARTKKGWSQANLAEFVACSRDAIKRLESGELDVRCSLLFRIMPVLELDESDLKRILFGQQGARRVT